MTVLLVVRTTFLGRVFSVQTYVQGSKSERVLAVRS